MVDIPRLPGVPALRGITRAANTVALVVADAAKILRMFQGPQWGLFDKNGKPFMVGDSVLGVAIRKDYRISHFPVEKGSFESYNRVELPFEVPLTFTIGGSDQDRRGFIELVKSAVASTETFTVTMPEFTYPSANVTRYAMERRARSGVSLLTVDVWVEEVRITATTAANSQQNTQSASGASPEGASSVQPTEPTAAQTSAATLPPDTLPSGDPLPEGTVINRETGLPEARNSAGGGFEASVYADNGRKLW